MTDQHSPDEKYYAKVRSLQAVLVKTADPTTIRPGSEQCDIEAAKLTKNHEIYNRLTVHAGARLAQLEKEYAERFLAVFASYDDAKLEAIGANRGDKKILVKAELREEQAKIDECKNALLYFRAMAEWCVQTTHYYKKIREAT
jgi:hypothetical protein